MNLHKPLDDEWKQWISSNVNKGCDKLELFNKCIGNHFEPKQVVSYLDIMNGAEWMDTEKCIMLRKKNLLTPEECNLVVENIKTGYQDSIVVGKGLDQSRRSRTKFYMHMKWLDDKFHQFMGSRESFAEPTQGTWYVPGGYYKQHADFFNEHSIENNLVHDYEKRGNRTWTVLVYLNDVTDGFGHTEFPYLNQKIQPERGTAICWYNLLPNQKGNTLTEHIAKEVNDEKFVIQKWYRCKQFP